MLEITVTSVTYNLDDKVATTGIIVNLQGYNNDRESATVAVVLSVKDLPADTKFDDLTRAQIIELARKKAVSFVNPAADTTPELDVDVDSIAYVLDKASSNTESIAIALQGYSTGSRNNVNLSVNLTTDDLDGGVGLDDLSRKQAEALARKKGAGYINPTAKTAGETPTTDTESKGTPVASEAASTAPESESSAASEAPSAASTADSSAESAAN